MNLKGKRIAILAQNQYQEMEASVVCIWLAAPRKVRAVAGRIPAR
jgi:hypothetical protein